MIDVADEVVHLAESKNHLGSAAVFAPTALVGEFLWSAAKVLEDLVEISFDLLFCHHGLVK